MPMGTWHNRAQLESLESIEVVYRYAFYALAIEWLLMTVLSYDKSELSDSWPVTRTLALKVSCVYKSILFRRSLNACAAQTP